MPEKDHAETQTLLLCDTSCVRNDWWGEESFVLTNINQAKTQGQLHASEACVCKNHADSTEKMPK